jgi:predicted MFS family arabinose efflux permease
MLSRWRFLGLLIDLTRACFLDTLAGPPSNVLLTFVYSRALHSAIFATVGAIGFLVSAVLPPTSYHARYGCLIIAAAGSFSCIPPLLGWLSSNLHSTAAAGLAIALNISFGAPGQITGVWTYKAEEKDKGYPTGHWVNAGLLFFVAVGCIALQSYYRMRNRVLKREGAERLFRY